MADASTTPNPTHPLVGAGLHRKDADGVVQNQAQIVAVVPSGSSATGDLALIQHFDWIMGEPSTRRLVPLAELASGDRWVLYASIEEMNDHYERVDKRQNERKRRQRDGDGPEGIADAE